MPPGWYRHLYVDLGYWRENVEWKESTLFSPSARACCWTLDSLDKKQKWQAQKTDPSVRDANPNTWQILRITRVSYTWKIKSRNHRSFPICCCFVLRESFILPNHTNWIRTVGFGPTPQTRLIHENPWHIPGQCCVPSSPRLTVNSIMSASCGVNPFLLFSYPGNHSFPSSLSLIWLLLLIFAA